MAAVGGLHRRWLAGHFITMQVWAFFGGFISFYLWPFLVLQTNPCSSRIIFNSMNGSYTDYTVCMKICRGFFQIYRSVANFDITWKQQITASNKSRFGMFCGTFQVSSGAKDNSRTSQGLGQGQVPHGLPFILCGYSAKIRMDQYPSVT